MKKALKIIFGIALGCFLLGCVVLGIGIATGGTMREFVEAVQNNKFAFHWDVQPVQKRLHLHRKM